MNALFSFARRHTILLLIGITFLLYIPSFFGSFMWDDEDFVYSNQYVGNFQVNKFFQESATAGRGKVSNYYRPLQLMTYAVEHKFFGFNPWVFHVSNVLWHIAAGIMVYLVMKAIRVPWALACGATLIFLVHPIQTEAVSYVSGRSDMMFVFFIMLAFIFHEKKGKRSAILSLVFFICGLLSKESALLAFALFPTLSFIKYGFSKEYKNTIRLYIPHFIIGLLYVVFRSSVLEFASTARTWGDNVYITSTSLRLATFFRNYFFYWQVLLSPYNLHMERDTSTVKIITSLFSIWTWLFVSVQALSVGALSWLYKRSRMYGQIAIGGYVGMHAVMGFYSGLIVLNGIFYEHYLYSALPFFSLWLGSYIVIMKAPIKTIMLMVIGIWIIVFGVVYNIHRQQDWADPVRFFTQTLLYAPNNVRAINSLGISYAERNYFNKAIETYNKGLSIDSTFPNFYHNIGMAYKGQKKYRKAEEYYFKALDISPHFNYSINALVFLAEMYVNNNELSEAIRLYKKLLLRLTPEQEGQVQVERRIYELEQKQNEKAN